MEIRVLQYFLTIAQEENISRAAEVLHITQPTLSRQIHQLEEELGTQLFLRGRRLTLTDGGILLKHHVEEILALVDKTLSDFQHQGEVCGTISIGSGGLSASQFLPPVMQAFRTRYPQVRFEFYTNSAEYIIERLNQGLLDFGLLLEPVDVAKFDYRRLPERERWGLLLRRDHPLAAQDVIYPQDLSGLPLITTARLPLQKELSSWLGYDFSQLDIFGTYNVVTHAAMFVQSGTACALTIEGAVNLLGGDLVFRPLAPELRMTSVLAWKKFKPHFSAAGKFLDFLQAWPGEGVDRTARSSSSTVPC
ncbi:MAG: LysR family transcriptional regulator [Selenomonas sp.]|nr:LysR family transcriptional regulator [Selenomonas sp.]